METIILEVEKEVPDGTDPASVTVSPTDKVVRRRKVKPIRFVIEIEPEAEPGRDEENPPKYGFHVRLGPRGSDERVKHFEETEARRKGANQFLRLFL
jgi:hypothetical protein